MDVRTLTASVAQCLQPGSPQRRDLGRRLEQLVEATRIMKAANVEATSLLTHITLVQARVFAPGMPLSDRERELALESLREALTPSRHSRMAQVHAIIVDHLSRILIPLFAASSPSDQLLPEPTRQLAIACWRQLVTAISSVHVPQTHPPPPHAALGALPCTVTLARYMAAYLPPDYLSLVACALLDNAELSDSHQLRTAALEALQDILRPELGVLSDSDILRPIFPGVSSALTRIALAQPPASSKQQAGDSQASPGLESKMGNMAVDASAWRKPTAAVRALAIDALRAAILALYRKPNAVASSEVEESLEAGWARRARHGIESILDESSEEKDDGSPDEYLRRLRHMLWRLAGLRHTEHAAISRALLRLFSSVALDCAALQTTPCASVAIEACFALDHSVPEYEKHVDRLAILCRDSDHGRTVAQLLDSALPMFDRYIARGSETQRLDVLALVAGYARVLPKPEAHAQLSPWWTARGLRLLLESLGVSLPGTSLLISEVASDSSSADRAPVPFVLDSYRTVELRAALDEFVRVVALVMSPAKVCAQVLALLTAPGEPSTLRPAALWLLTSVAPMATREEMAAVYQPAFQFCVDYFGALDSAPNAREEEKEGEEASPLDASDSPALQSLAHMQPHAKPSVASLDSDSDRVLQSCAVLNAISAIV
ncbi:hypothetical protein GGF42_007774, partial [Coemansia sp. RSA 2424]